MNINKQLNAPGLKSVFEQDTLGYSFKVYFIGDSCWLVAAWPKGSRIAFRMAYSPSDNLELKKILDKDQKVTFQITSIMDKYEVIVQWPTKNNPMLRLTTSLKASAPLLFPYWRRDIVPLGAAGSDVLAEGEIKVSQVGTRSGQLYFSFSRPKAGPVLTPLMAFHPKNINLPVLNWLVMRESIAG